MVDVVDLDDVLVDIERGSRCGRQLLDLLKSLRLRLSSTLDGYRMASSTTLERTLVRRRSSDSSEFTALCREFSEDDVDEDGESKKKDRTESDTDI
ncbi:Hypothetical protein PHPALM_1812, partial [Phytophthora palmivora]